MKGASVGARTSPAAIIVGAGLMGRHHARAAAAAGASIVAIVDRNRDAAAALAAIFDGAAVETKIETALSASRADVAHICTPPESHQSVGRMVSEAGLHALIEKPIASTADEAGLIHECFARNGKFVCPTHQYAFQRSVMRAAGRLPQLGTLRRIAFDICSAGAAEGMDRDEVVAEILPHPLAMVQKLVPEADLAELEWSCLRSAPGEWLISAQIDHAILSIEVSMSGRPTRFLTRITADAGSIDLDNFHDFAVQWPGQVSRAQKIVQPFMHSGAGLAAAGWNLAARAMRGESAYPGLRTLVSDFYRAVRDPANVPPPITPEQSLAVAYARDRIIALAADG